MGLFSFVKDIGTRLFTNDAQAGEKIAEAINADNPGINGLKVEFKDSVAYLSGEAQSIAAVQKATLIAGNTQGISSVNVDGVKLPGGASAASVETDGGVQYYIIQSGDNLSKIAKHFYGDPNKYPVIFEANREVIKDANKIFPGQKIRIPAA
jgi:nucleoid-associated protein YgaU